MILQRNDRSVAVEEGEAWTQKRGLGGSRTSLVPIVPQVRLAHAGIHSGAVVETVARLLPITYAYRTEPTADLPNTAMKVRERNASGEPPHHTATATETQKNWVIATASFGSCSRISAADLEPSPANRHRPCAADAGNRTASDPALWHKTGDRFGSDQPAQAASPLARNPAAARQSPMASAVARSRRVVIVVDDSGARSSICPAAGWPPKRSTRLKCRFDAKSLSTRSSCR